MNIKLLIDAIVCQTTVLIAQLSTTAGVRAPLSNLADQVFLQLSREIEGQGVGRKVAADMFGLTLRGYRKKVQRLAESQTDPGRTLSAAVFDYLGERGPASRHAILARFSRDDPASVGAVLSDLVVQGLVYRSGTGDRVVFGQTKQEDQAQLLRDDEEVLPAVVWLTVHREPSITREQICARIGVSEDRVNEALRTLVQSGRVTEADGRITSASAVIPVGSEHGWEAAVLDHFQAVVAAIGTKLRLGFPRSSASDVIGGETLTFDVYPNHPRREAVLGLLARVRAQVDELWDEVEAINQQRPIDETEIERVVFYFGQSLLDAEEQRDEA